LGMHLALEGICVSDIKPTVLEAFKFAISCEIIACSLVITLALAGRAHVALEIMLVKYKCSHLIASRFDENCCIHLHDTYMTNPNSTKASVNTNNVEFCSQSLCQIFKVKRFNHHARFQVCVKSLAFGYPI
jgi:hypothetical protein